MQKQTIQYSNALDALIEVVKRLAGYEAQSDMNSEMFFQQYTQGHLSDDAKYIAWANDYRHYLALHEALKHKLKHAA